MSVPMEWELTNPISENDNNLKNRIYNRLVPKDCFKSEDNYSNIDRQVYFELHHGINLNDTHDKILERMVTDWKSKPYCWVCYDLDEENNNIIEHEHDISLSSDISSNYPGKFRSRACRRCNAIESHAKTIHNKMDRFNYWAMKKNWNTNEEREFFYSNLLTLGYLEDYF
tara:strand:+ start:1589 stop:2098 length:510 start_codon:yes stop_codon:yes gene_type:complete